MCARRLACVRIGHDRTMRFWIGFGLGVAAGSYLAAKMTEEQRAATARSMQRAMSAVRSTQVVEAVERGVADVAEAAGERVSSVVADGTDAVSSFVETSD